MEFVGNKDEVYGAVLEATALYPELTIAEFQALFHFLSNESEASLLHQTTIARITVNQELLGIVTSFGSLAALSQSRYGDKVSGDTLYKQAVFSQAAHLIIGNQISSDATKEAAERQEAMSQKASHCLVSYRRAIDTLINNAETYTIEVI